MRVEGIGLHHVVAQLLFLCNCARHDIQTAVAFLATRVKNLIWMTGGTQEGCKIFKGDKLYEVNPDHR